MLLRPLASLILAAGLVLSGAAQALAGQAVTLKAEVVNADGLVTLGDLFHGAGSAAGVPVARKPGLTVVLDAGAVQQTARRAGLDWANAEGLRRIVVRTAAAPSTAGQAVAPRGNVEVLTYARSLAAGEVVQPQDLIWAKAAAAPADAAADASQLIGLEARRPLRAGSVASARDVSAPQVIASGDLITLTYEHGGVTLSLQARARGRAALGETFAAENLTSRRVVQAVATGPGQGAVGPAADQFMAQSAVRFASR